MKFNELPKKWRAAVIILAVLTVLFTVAIVLFCSFWREYQKTCAAMRAPLEKPDSERIGERMEIQREHNDPVTVNLYVPNDDGSDKLPVVINIHGGGFVGGDADVLDTQSNRIANEWKAIIVSANYTKADVKPISYGSEEIRDTALYFAAHAEEYNADAARIYIMGYSAGAYYAAEGARMLQESGFDAAGLMLCYPWTTGLPTQNLSADYCPTLFILAGQDQISQNAKPYAESMKNAGIEVEVKEYENAVHSFIESNNPEGSIGSTEDMSGVINPEQEQLARNAECFIKEWILSQ